MLDQLQKALHYSPEKVSNDSFHDWKQSPVTQELLHYISHKYMIDCTDGLPLDPSIGTPYAQRIEGSRALLEMIFDWIPEHALAVESGDAEDD